jgi:hypothetical protein
MFDLQMIVGLRHSSKIVREHFEDAPVRHAPERTAGEPKANLRWLRFLNRPKPECAPAQQPAAVR